MFPALLNHHAKLNLKKLLETIDDYTNILSKDAEELLNFVQKAVTNYKDAIFAASSSVIAKDKEGGSQEETRDILSIFFSSDVKELGRGGRKSEVEEASGNFVEDDSGELDRVPSPIYRIFEGLPDPEIQEYMHPNAEAQFLASFKFRGPLTTFLDKSDVPDDLLGTSRWLASYLSTVTKLLLAKVKEIETGLTVTALKEFDEEGSQSSENLRSTTQSVAGQGKQESILCKYLDKIHVAQESTPPDMFFDDLSIEDEEEDPLLAFRKQLGYEQESIDDSPFNPPKEESPEQVEAFTDLLHQLSVQKGPSQKIKIKDILTPVFITQKTSQIIKRNNFIQLENTGLELFLSKRQVTVNLNELGADDPIQQTWGQALTILLYRLNVFKEDSVSMKDTATIATGEASVDSKGAMRTISTSSGVINDTDTSESVPVHELPRYMYIPPKEVIDFEPLTSEHVFDVQPPHYRLLSIEESAKRADVKRELSKKMNQVKREIRQVFSKEVDSESESDEDEESGWKKWICFERRRELVNAALDYLVVLNEALHDEAMSALKELTARKETITLEILEKSANNSELIGLQRIKDTPREYRLPSQRKFSDVLFKVMKAFLSNDWKMKNLKMAELRTLSNRILELSKTVRRLDILEKKVDWGDLALQRLQFNSAQRRNTIVDDDKTQLKKLDSTYTLKLIHAREELDAKIRQNKSVTKHRDLALKKKNSHKDIHKSQFKKLSEAQENLQASPKVSEMERFFIRAKTADYMKKKIKQYRTELELRQADKRAKCLRSRIEGLAMDQTTKKRMKGRFKKIATRNKIASALKNLCQEVEKKEFGIKIVPLGPTN